MQESVFRLVYTSRASPQCDSQALARILATARDRNPAANISGQLLFEEGVFAQWLEGPRSNIEQLWAALQRDPRHRGIQLVSATQIDKRVFAQWSMAITSAQHASVSHVQGFVNERVAELPAILNFPDQILGLFDLLAELESLNRNWPR
jgi:hypothetical protein